VRVGLGPVAAVTAAVAYVPPPPPDVFVDVGNPSGFFAEYYKAGFSARGALAAFREAGGHIGNEYGRALYAQVGAVVDRYPESSGLDPFAVPTAGDYTPWEIGAGGKYATQVWVQVREVGTGDITSTPYTYFSDDPHTPDEAEQAGIDQLSVLAEPGGTFQGAIMGAVHGPPMRTYRPGTL
jgi:hypothetical protein